MEINDTIFKEDNAILNLIDIIENGKESFILATEIPNAVFPAKMTLNTDGTYDIEFYVSEKYTSQITGEFFFTHHFILATKGLNLLIQNKDIKSFKQQIVSKDGNYKTVLNIVAFRGDLDDNLWSNSKQVAFCSILEKRFAPYQAGVIFDMAISGNQTSSWKSCIKLDIDSNCFRIYFVKTDNKQYLILKSQKDVNHDTFLEVLECVRTTIGLLSGYYISDSVWYMAMHSHDKKLLTFRFEKNGNSVYNNHPLLACEHYKNLSENKLKLSSEQFENIVRLFYINKEIRRSALLLIYAGNSNGISRGCLAAVALETIKSQIIPNEANKSSESIIDNKKLLSQIKRELSTSLSKFKNLIDKKTYTKLESQLGTIYQVSNSEKLEAPFEKLGIKLSAEESYCLKCRNFLLHGASLKTKEGLYEFLNQHELVDMISNRLIMLTAMLILKKCGYNGMIVDWGYTEIAKWRMILAREIVPGGKVLRDISEQNID